MSLLQVRDLHVTFGPGTEGHAGTAVRGVGFDLAPGEVLGVVGESGSGKSTIALALMGLLPPSAHVTGSVRLRGVELIGRSDRELARIRGNEIAMVFQDPLTALTPSLTVGRQIAEAVLAHQAVTRAAARGRVLELLHLVGIPEPARTARAFPHQLSGGMRQRVLIAMAIANSPAVLIADEPTTALDVTVQAQVLEVLETARHATGAGTVMITHDLGVVARTADRVLILRSGEQVESGPADEVFHRPSDPHTAGLLRAFSRPCPRAAPRTAERPLHSPGRGSPDTAGAAIGRGGRIVLEVDDLVRHHQAPGRSAFAWRARARAVRAVDGVTFDLREGETLGVVGESGCGKTTLLMDIMRLAAPQRGSIRLLGHDTAALTPARRRALRRELQLVFQDPCSSLDPRMTVGAIVAEPLAVQGWSRERISGRVPELLRLVGLEPALAGRRPAALSGGQRQRVGIARALAPEPRVVALDEAVSALDPSVRSGVLALLADLRARLGLSYLFVAHDLTVVGAIADRVAVMYLGRIVEIGSVRSVFAAPAHPYTRALLSAVPVPDPRLERARRRVVLPGEPPDPARPPSGCRFRTRCPLHAGLVAERAELCRSVEPPLRDVHRAASQPAPRDVPQGAERSGDRMVACHYAEVGGP